MSKKDSAETAQPEAVEEIQAEAVTSATASARSAAIAQYMRSGYKTPAGVQRHVRSVAHAEFLARSGVIELP